MDHECAPADSMAMCPQCSKCGRFMKRPVSPEAKILMIEVTPWVFWLMVLGDFITVCILAVLACVFYLGNMNWGGQ